MSVRNWNLFYLLLNKEAKMEDYVIDVGCVIPNNPQTNVYELF